MALTSTERAAFLALLPHLGPDEGGAPIQAFLRDRWQAVLDEIADEVGFDQVRAGLVRAVLPQREDPAVAEALAAAARSLRAFPEQVAEVGHTLLLSRHPAWVGVAALELVGGPEGAPKEAIDFAVNLAAVGFVVLAGKAEVARGEALWAMAEQVEEAGWSGRARVLLGLAASAPFADDEHAAQVRFLYALRLAEDEDDGALERLAEVVADPHADARTHTHAAWIASRVSEAQGDTEAARAWLRAALDGVDPEEEPAAADRISERLDALTGAS